MQTRTHHILSRTTATLFLFLGCQHGNSLAADAWDMSTVTKNRDGILVVRGSANRDLRVEDPEITVVDDADAQSKRVLSFSGTQAKAATSSKLYEGNNSVSLRLKVKPASTNSDDDQTVLVRPGAYELRYHTKRQQLDILISYKDNTPLVAVRANLVPDRWNDVEVTVKGSDITVKVNDQTTDGRLPNGATINPAKSYLRVGRMDQSRPFKGQIADISVSEPAE